MTLITNAFLDYVLNVVHPYNYIEASIDIHDIVFIELELVLLTVLATIIYLVTYMCIIITLYYIIILSEAYIA